MRELSEAARRAMSAGGKKGGGTRGVRKGFAVNPELAKIAGEKGRRAKKPSND